MAKYLKIEIARKYLELLFVKDIADCSRNGE